MDINMRINKIKELTAQLNKYRNAYCNENKSLVSDGKGCINAI